LNCLGEPSWRSGRPRCDDVGFARFSPLNPCVTGCHIDSLPKRHRPDCENWRMITFSCFHSQNVRLDAHLLCFLHFNRLKQG
jgi:hypothetical protein